MHKRLDGDIAELAYMAAVAAGLKKHGGAKFKPSDFCQWGVKEEPPATVEQVFALFKGLAKADK